MKRRALWAFVLFFIYSALTIVLTYPLIRYVSTHHVGEAGGDAKIYLWNYWWVSRALAAGASPFWTDAIFHPIGIGLAFHTLAPLQGVSFSLLRGVVGEVAAANTVVMWTFVASALAAYALAREVGASRGGAFVAGVLFSFCPYRLARLAGHYDLLGTEWIPLFVLLLLKSRERRWLAPAAGVALAAAAYTAATYAVFLALFTALLVAFRRDLWLRALASGAVAALLLLPMLGQAVRDLSAWTYPEYPGTERYAATLGAYVTPPGGGTEVAAARANRTESTVFLGYTAIALGLVGAARARAHAALPFWLTSTAVFLILSLGGPLFELVRRVPVFENLRAPARLAVLVMLSLAVVAALALSRGKGVPLFPSPSERGVSKKVTKTKGVPLFTVLKKGYPFFLTSLLVFEVGSAPVPLFSSEMPEVYARLAGEDGALAVAEIPGIEQAPAEVMFHQTGHGKPIFIGTAARVPREKADYYMGLPLVRPLIDLRKGRLELTDELIERERHAAPAVARFLGLGHLVLDKAYAKRGVIDFVERVLPVERWDEDDTRVVLKIRREALPEEPRVIEAGSPESRQHFESGWERPEREAGFTFRWANRERSTLLFRRPPGTRVAVVELAPLETGRDLTTLSTEDERYTLSPGWQEIRAPLPPTLPSSAVERLTLHWSSLQKPSDEDPRRLAARVRRIRFE